ncbi:MAG TPA: hypothetical protein VHD87_12665 [Acidimicrobiales bacterium]|nr:hypothetical protein [Acidimicrobiales bacterium]
MGANLSYKELAALPLAERRAALDVAWWEPKTKLSAEDRAWFEELPYWREKISQALPSTALEHYRRRDAEAAAVSVSLPEESEILAIPDHRERLRVADEMVTAARLWYQRMSKLRGDCLLDAVENGMTTPDIGDTLKVSETRVRQLHGETRKERGIPVPPKAGGRPRVKREE